MDVAANAAGVPIVDRSSRRRPGRTPGFRIRSSTPLLAGMTGMVMTVLPKGTRVDLPVMVRWSRVDEETGAYEVGLRAF